MYLEDLLFFLELSSGLVGIFAQERVCNLFVSYRASPGNFLKRIGKNKGPRPRNPIPAKVLKLWRPFEVTFILMASKPESTPSHLEELELLRAGLGRRIVNITHDFSHTEV